MNPSNKIDIVFVCQEEKSFVAKDISILNEIGNVHVVSGFKFIHFRDFPALIRAVYRCDLVFIWFLGRNAVVPLILGWLLRKKIILVAGGWDVADCSTIRYGLLSKGWLSVVIRQLLRIPDLIVAVSESNHQEVLVNGRVPEKKTVLIYHGFDDIGAAMDVPKERMVISIGEISIANLIRKGHLDFVKSASYLPEIPFYLIGNIVEPEGLERLKMIAGSNVTFTGYLSGSELLAFMKRATVYAQLSFHEAFGCSLAEAMLAKCIPVVSGQYALPEVVGETGFVVPHGNPELAAEAIRNALSKGSLADKARSRILENFSFASRKNRLIEEVQRVMNAKP